MTEGFESGAIPGLAEEHRMVRDLVVKFVERDLMPLEPAVLAREAQGQRYGLTEEEEAPLLAKCRELGLWGLDVPEEFGGADLPLPALMAIEEEMGRTVTPGERMSISRKEMLSCGLPCALVRTRQNIQSAQCPHVVQVFCPLTT